MGKKNGFLSLYFIGMVLVAVGFCLPMIKGIFGTSANGFEFIKNINKGGFVAIGALLIFGGAVLGILSSFVPALSGLSKIFFLVSVAGGVIIVIGFLTNGGIYKAVGKHLIKNSMYGLWLIVAGWVVSALGISKN